MMTFVLIFLLSYLVGSLPTAYLLVKRKVDLDIRTEGTGSVGGLNSYRVTRSKAVGLTVLIVDMVKGALAVAAVRLLFGNEFLNLALAAIGAVIGHNFSVWIGFKGGRGLATAAGAMFVINPLMVAVWCLGWVIVFIITRNVHWGNILATGLTPLILCVAPLWIFTLTPATNIHVNQSVSFGFLLCGIIFIKHVKPLGELLRSGKVTKAED
jgi:glycerol-3-phosphate acyltransferase PlsY